MRTSKFFFRVALLLMLAGFASHGFAQVPLDSILHADSTLIYSSDSTHLLDTLGRPAAAYMIIPYVFHTGLTYAIDSLANMGVTANLGQGIIQLVGSDQDSIGQGFWYQLQFRKKPQVPGYGDSLFQNYPNPFNPLTYVPFSISDALHQHRQVKVLINLTSVLGVVVKTIVDDWYVYGYYAVLFDASSLTSGTYVYQMTIDDYGPAIPTHSEFSKKMVFLR